MNMEANDVINLLIFIVALSAFILSIIELKNYKQKENNKLLSQLNKRYIENFDVQLVVKYLREIQPSNVIPSAYQIELFLRFFEELGVYLRNDSLKKEDVENFFGYYFERFEKSDRGKVLKEIINHEDEKLEYLEIYKNKTKPK